MLDVLAMAAVPLRPEPLALLLAERKKQDIMQAWAGNIQWSILASLHALGGGKCTAPTYSQMQERIREIETCKTRHAEKSVRASVERLLNSFPQKAKE